MDAMLYFLVNSTTLLLVLGTLFFLLGLWLGVMIKGKSARSPLDQKRELSGLRSRIQSLQAEHHKQQQYASGLEERLRLAEEANAATASQPALPSPSVASLAEVDALQRRLNQLQAELDIENGNNATLNADLSATAARAEEAEKRLATAQRDRDSLREELREMEQQLAPAHHLAPPLDNSERDDLTRLKGVGDTICRKLNDNGVYSYRQIAEWNEQDIEHFDQIVGFGERIQREDWVGQASRLHQQKSPQES